MPIISGGGGGGGSGGPSFVGAVLTLSGADIGYASGDTVAFDTAAFDSDGFFNAAGNDLVVPAGLAGWYRVGCVVNATAFDLATQTDQALRVDTSGNPDNLLGVFVPDEPSGGDGTCAGVMGPLAVGDNLRTRLFWNGGGTATVLVSGSQLTCQYLGPDA